MADEGRARSSPHPSPPPQGGREFAFSLPPWGGGLGWGVSFTLPPGGGGLGWGVSFTLPPCGGWGGWPRQFQGRIAPECERPGGANVGPGAGGAFAQALLLEQRVSEE